jgi:thioesterase domain-containing protein
MIARIEQELGVDLPLATLFQGATIERLAEILEAQSESGSWSPLVALQPRGSKPPFFCVHPIGGNVFCYADLARYLGPDQPFYGIQAIGVDGSGSAAHTTIQGMASGYVEAIRSVQPSGPYYLGGWSMGGVVAFEMAQQLAARGEEVALVALLDSSNPEQYEDPTAVDDEAIEAGFNDALAIVLKQMGMSEMSPQEIAPLQYERLFQVYKTNMRAWRQYVPKPYSGRLTLLRADARDAEANEMLAAGWSELTVNALDVVPVPGNHYTMVIEPNIRVLADCLSECLNRAQIGDLAIARIDYNMPLLESASGAHGD